MTKLTSILPSQCVVVEECDGLASDVGLYPEEWEFVSTAQIQRRQEFAAGRRCARKALGLLGRPLVALPPGEGGAPRWPHGVIGSVTHCHGFVGVALARADQLRALGIDAEPHSSLPEGVLDFIAVPEELSRTADLMASLPELRWDRLLFSAKEAVYKAWYPLTREWLEFEQIRIVMNLDQQFSASISHPAGTAIGVFNGRWRVTENVVLTAAFLPVDA